MVNEKQLIEVKWSYKTKAHYVKLGYEFTKVGDSFMVKYSELPGATTYDIMVKCDFCEKEYLLRHNRYLKSIEKYGNVACSACKQKRNEKERAKEHYEAIVRFCRENGYMLITSEDEIKTNQSVVRYKCPKHGIYETKVINIKEGKTCYQCSREKASNNRAKTTLKNRQDAIYDKINKSFKNTRYTLMTPKSKIQRYTDSVEYICEKHGSHIARAGNLISGKGCPDCASEKNAESYKLDKNEVEKRISALGGNLLNSNEYQNVSAKNLRIKCPNCQEEFITSLRCFTQHGGQVCPKCSEKAESNGERKIRKFLESQNMNFIQEKWFSDCRDINPLPFDFYIPDLNVAIEYDGLQHFEDTNFFQYSFRKNKEHDEIKNTYCNSNNIKLIRIPYWDFNNIETILENELFVKI